MNGWLSGIGLAVVSTLAAELLTRAPSRAWAATQRRVRADHRSLDGCSWRLVSGLHSTSLFGVRVRAIAAPSRSLPNGLEFDPGKAVRFLQEHFPELPATPAYSSSTEGARLEHDAGTEHGYAWVWRNGRVDLDVFVPASTDDEGRALIPLMDIVAPIERVRLAVTSSTYQHVFGTRTRMTWRQRFDWHITVSTTLTRPDGSTGSWDDLIFPGRHPQRAAKQAAFCPPRGYAGELLRNWHARRRSQPTSLFLQDFLAQNGYHNTAGAIDDVLARVVLKRSSAGA